MSRILRLMALCCAALCSQMTFAQPRVIGIDELFRLAEEQSMSIRSFESGAAAAAEGVRAARAERLPDVGVTVSASFLGDGRLWDRSFGEGMKVDIPHFGNNFALEAQQVVYAGGAVRSGIRMAELEQRDAETSLERNRQDICFLLLGHYLNLYKADNRIRTLLTAAAAGALVCNLVTPHVRLLPLLWAVCFVEGMCKIQGTFECMSTIQLWITPQRDFTAFFPVLHIVILGCMQLSTIITTALMHHYHWVWMHLLVSALMAVDLLIVRLCTRHFRIVRKMPLYGIDWLGALLWVALLLQVAYLFDYGEWYDWWYSPVMRRLAVTSVATLALCLWRMNTIRHPYIEPRMWSYRHLFPILILITLVEMLLATEHVLEGAFYEQTMHYDATVSVLVTRWVLVGVLAGCGFAYWWMHVRRMSYVRLLTVGIAALAAYLLGYYFTVSADIHVSQLYLPAACRGFAYAILSATFMVCLEEIMTFQHFFQALSVFNMLHMVVGGVIGAAIYTEAFTYYTADNMARYGAAVDSVAFTRAPFDMWAFMEGFAGRMIATSVKQVYGWAAYACIGLLLLFLLYDAPARRALKPIPMWRTVRSDVARSLRRIVVRR